MPNRLLLTEGERAKSTLPCHFKTTMEPPTMLSVCLSFSTKGAVTPPQEKTTAAEKGIPPKQTA